ncbi:peptide-methionine (S)-S-oxide reductase MsrA [Lyngbya confervoides]|uniref:Peptide methionine sulfoxide reductase MsrA n=1 Tax=Lyngbya confervoides BDU141951 TaxID=1574623 RepID=A0ABD4T574_9CYAN|nr:peptide-methionine (S)-S-oxide reductase MsrA [Lyngbya confervoides]MCM1983838.1 peptide-methionine (S)-S-oxide reductase MsrA [Lyngbya confervoides BDU141951]
MTAKRWFFAVLLCGLLLFGCHSSHSLADPSLANRPEAAHPPEPVLAEATFAGGCFWCMEKPFDLLAGVVETTSGYTGGSGQNPTYRQVSSGGTGHVEAVRVRYDPDRVSYDQLLSVFWKNVDPLDAQGQFCDRGSQYQARIFYHNSPQQQQAEASKQALEASGQLPGPITTQIVAATPFYPAEDYHQDYYQKNPLQYQFYRLSCGRDHRLSELWGNAQSVSLRP